MGEGRAAAPEIQGDLLSTSPMGGTRTETEPMSKTEPESVTVTFFRTV